MTRKLQQQLYEKYPEIFADRLGGWGIECDDGWYDLIDKLCRNIMVLPHDAQCIQLMKEYENDVCSCKPRASQVKEKYGTLRFYVNNGSDAAYHFISVAEKVSSITCEICGKVGLQFINNNGWMKTLCVSDALALGYITD